MAPDQGAGVGKRNGDEELHMCVVLHLLRAAKLMSSTEEQTRKRAIRTGRDRRPTCIGNMEFDIDHSFAYAEGHAKVPVPVMVHAYQKKSRVRADPSGGGSAAAQHLVPVLEVFDTESISSGLWGQYDFDCTDDRNRKVRIIRSPISIPPHLRVLC